MSKQDRPDDNASSADEAELTRTFHRIASALERGDVSDLAAALSRDPAPRRPGSYGRPKEK